MSAPIKSVDSVEVETTPATQDGREGQVAWSIAINGQDHGGGWASDHRAATQAAANYVRDLELGLFEEEV